jgi:hypothetical protein
MEHLLKMLVGAWGVARRFQDTERVIARFSKASPIVIPSEAEESFRNR